MGETSRGEDGNIFSLGKHQEKLVKCISGIFNCIKKSKQYIRDVFFILIRGIVMMSFGGSATTMGLVVFCLFEVVALCSARKTLLNQNRVSDLSFRICLYGVGVINFMLIMLNENFGYGGAIKTPIVFIVIGIKTIIETLIIKYSLKIPRSEAIIPGVISNVLCFFAVGFIFPKVGGYIDDRVTFLLGFNLFIIFLIMIPVLFFSLHKLLHKDG